MLLIKCFGISLLMMIGADAAFAVESELPLSPLFENCEKVNHTQWINKYNELELKVVEALEENSKNFLIKNIDFLEVIYPQELPRDHPMRGAFLYCYDRFQKYKKSIGEKQIKEALLNLEYCFQDAYKINPPPVIEKYLICLKSLKR